MIQEIYIIWNAFKSYFNCCSFIIFNVNEKNLHFEDSSNTLAYKNWDKN